MNGQNALDLHETSHELQGTPALLSTLLAGLPDRALACHPAAGKWCIKEVIGHLIEEDKRDFVGRIQMMLEQEEPALPLNDQEEVARLRHDCEKNLRALLDEFSAVRSSSVTFVTKLTQPQLDCSGVHPKIGRFRVAELLYEWIYHDLNHVKQIGTNIQRFLWDHLGNMQHFYQH